MDLPQTNLQLYRLLLARDADEASLVAVRTAYDTAVKLFAAAYRSSGKPFVCHLVGTAGALAEWRQPTDVVVAGLLHSVYLFGKFDDGRSGASEARRTWFRANVGNDAEALVAAYTTADWKRPIEEIDAWAAESELHRRIFAIKLADVLDELSDGSPVFAPQKHRDLELGGNPQSQAAIVKVACRTVSPLAGDMLAAAFTSLSTFKAPRSLQSRDNRFRTQSDGVPQLRCGVVHRTFNRFTTKLHSKRAAR